MTPRVLATVAADSCSHALAGPRARGSGPWRVLAAGLLLALLTVLAGCAATPVARIRAIADEQRFQASTVQAQGFAHLVFSNDASAGGQPSASDPAHRAQPQGGDAGDTAVLHVYLEGDGSPWKHRTVIMPDPTPRRPVMLRLMAMDATAAVYIGRPCYNGTSLMPECENSLWTSGRYSETVVRSMQGVLRRLIERAGARRVRLFGHSGGGTLAMLLAARVPEVDTVVTLAGNLDVDAWTRHHQYTPLYSSLDPARQPVLPDRIRQWHLLGERDAVIPPGLVRGEIRRQGGLGLLFEDYSHGCCWQRVWPRVLRALQQEDERLLPGMRLVPVNPVQSRRAMPASNRRPG